MRSGKAKVVEYWEVVLKCLHLYKAKACLKEIHSKLLRRHLHRLEQPLRGENLQTEEKAEEEEIEHKIEDLCQNPSHIMNHQRLKQRKALSHHSFTWRGN